MIAKTERFQLLHPRIIRAYLDLSNPRRTVCKPLVKGQAAGQLNLIYAHWPPEGISPHDVPGRFTFDFELSHVADFELHLMVHFIDREYQYNDFVLGLVNSGQRAKLREAVPSLAEDLRTRDCWVGVRYHSVRRGEGGHVYLSKKLYEILLQYPMLN